MWRKSLRTKALVLAMAGAVGVASIVLAGRMNGNETKAASSETPEALANLVVGYDHSLALTSAGNLYSWGLNECGQIGDGTTTNGIRPKKVVFSGKSGDDGVDFAFSGRNHSLATTSAGKVFCWGGNTSGQLGDGTTTNRLLPVDITSGFGFTDGEKVTVIAGGIYNSIALTSSGRVFTWGGNQYGEIGDGTTVRKTSPVDITSGFGLTEGETIATISCGSISLCCYALTSSGRAYAWGNNGNYEIGDGTKTCKTSPVDITSEFALSSGETIKTLSGNGGSSFVLTSNGRVYAWGRNDLGQVGDGTTTSKTSPVDITSEFALSSGETIASISVADGHTFALTSSNSLYAWGYNYYGQLGDGFSGTGTNVSVPKKVTLKTIPTSETIQSIAGGMGNSFVLTSSGAAYAWGWDYNGELGSEKNTASVRTTPDVIEVSPDYIFAANLFDYKTCTEYESAYTALSADHAGLTSVQSSNLSTIYYNDYPYLASVPGSYDYSGSSKTVSTSAAAKWAAISALYSTAHPSQAINQAGKGDGAESETAEVIVLATCATAAALAFAGFEKKRLKKSQK